MVGTPPRPQEGTSFRPRRAMLIVAFAILALLAVVPLHRASAQEPLPEPTVTLSPFEEAMFARINEVRAEYGLHPYVIQLDLQEAADRHVADMARFGRRSHTGSDGTNPRRRMVDAGYPGTDVNESIGWGYNINQMVNFWLNSPVHRRMLLNSTYTELGVGHENPTGRNYGHWWVLDFGTQ